MSRRPTLTVLLLLVACDKKDDDGSSSSSSSSSSGTTGSAWIVGDDGEILNVDADGNTTRPPRDDDRALLGIACKGSDRAWVVGERGALLSTIDGGLTWETHAVDPGTTLRAVATAAADNVWIVGDAGVVLRSSDEGATFSRLDAAGFDFTGVATDMAGERALATTAIGSIVEIDGGPAETVFAGADQPLYGIALTPDGRHVVAVGGEGLLLRSDDGGRNFVQIPVPTVRDLFGVRMAGAGDTVLAIGEAGVVLRIAEDGASATELLDSSVRLLGLHLDHLGHGHAVGEAGIVLHTRDFGASWAAVDVGTDRDLFGVDDLHGEPHW